MKRSLLPLIIILIFAAGLDAGEKLVRIGEVFTIDRAKFEVIISGKSLETVPDGQIMKIMDEKNQVITTMKSVKNNAATLRASFVSGQFSLIKEKMGVFVIVIEPNQPLKNVSMSNSSGSGIKNSLSPVSNNGQKLIDPVQVKILDEPPVEKQGFDWQSYFTFKKETDPKTLEYNKRKMSVGRLVGAEFSALCLPGSGLGHYIVKDVKGGLIVNILAVSGIGLYIANEYAIEYWDAYRYNNAALYSITHYTTMAIFVTGYLYDLIDTPIKWSKYNQGIKKELGIALMPDFMGGGRIVLTYKF